MTPSEIRAAIAEVGPRNENNFGQGVDSSALVTTEVPCPIPDCGSIVFAPNDGDSDNVRVDCLDCGAALLTRRGIDGAVTLEVTEDAVDTEDLEASPLPLAAGHHIAELDVSEPSNDLDSKEETHG